jgi:hypothetical protein
MEEFKNAYVTMEYDNNKKVYRIYLDAISDTEDFTQHETLEEKNYDSPEDCYLEALKAFRTHQRRYCGA